MAAFWCSGHEFYEIVGDFGGYKAGLGLTHEEIRDHVTKEGLDLPAYDAGVIRVRYDELEEIVRALLYAVGALRSRQSGMQPTLQLYFKYRDDTEATAIVATIVDTLINGASKEPSGGPVDLTPVFEQAVRRHGRRGLEIAQEFYSLLEEYMQGSILAAFRRTEWEDVAALRELFESEGLEPSHGSFLDQRFIDYLGANFEKIDVMNWRKFEALAAEFFEREGYAVKMGPGRDDGGIDVRVWKEDQDVDGPPTILVQCKRQKAKVGKVVVKALWADVMHEEAESGLIVTTSALEPGAAALAVARSYPVRAAERDKLREWIQALRTPGTGVALIG